MKYARISSCPKKVCEFIYRPGRHSCSCPQGGSTVCPLPIVNIVADPECKRASTRESYLLANSVLQRPGTGDTGTHAWLLATPHRLLIILLRLPHNYLLPHFLVSMPPFTPGSTSSFLSTIFCRINAPCTVRHAGAINQVKICRKCDCRITIEIAAMLWREIWN